MDFINTDATSPRAACDDVELFSPTFDHGTVTRDYAADQPSAVSVHSIEAGSSLTFKFTSHADMQSMVHPGFVQVYLAQIPQGGSFTDTPGFDERLQWFKVYQSEVTPLQEKSAEEGYFDWQYFMESTMEVKIPSCVSPGQYLIRVAETTMHRTTWEDPVGVPKNEYYVGCSQLDVTGSGSTKPKGRPIPGDGWWTQPATYQEINIWDVSSQTQEFVHPGGDVFQC